MAPRRRGENSFPRFGRNTVIFPALHYPHVYLWQKGAYVDGEEEFDGEVLDAWFRASRSSFLS